MAEHHDAEVVTLTLDLGQGRELDDARERALQGYPTVLKQTYGGYYTVGRLFVKAIGDDRVEIDVVPGS